jgi:TetR/AcrR family transcriptional repressor of lmrAB and yxaGH operons
MRLFRRKGYASTGLQEILEVSGAPKGSLYYYFPDGKEALAEAALLMAGDLALDTLQTIAARHRTPRTFIRAWCRQYADWMEESGFTSGSPMATTVLETVPQSERLLAASRGILDRQVDAIADILRADGVTPARAKRVALTLISALEGALILSRIRQSKAPILELASVIDLRA